MWEFIAWLYEQAEKVRELFGWLWSRVKTTALYALNWAIDEGWKAYNRAASFARGLFDDAVSLVNSLSAALGRLISDVYQWAAAQIHGGIDYVKAWAKSFIESSLKPVYDLYNTLKAWVLAQIVTAQAFIKPLIDQVKADLTNLFAPILPLLDPLKDLAALFNPENKIKFLDLVGDLYGSLKLFVANPIGFIFGVMWSNFINFLCFALAYALGSTKYTLPPRPAWGFPGAGGPILPGTPPPPGTSGLVNPLDPVYISGYIFRAGHPGIDLGCIANQPIFAMHDGIIRVSGWSNVGYGFYAILEGSEWWTLYAHLSSLNVQVNQTVKAGEVLGGGDSTGNSTGNHLHLEIKYKGSFIDPITVLQIG